MEQAGAIRVDDMDQLVDLAALFLYMPPVRGRRVGMIGMGGGVSVMASDHFFDCGLLLPGPPEAIRKKLREASIAAGNIFSNPLDTQTPLRQSDGFEKTLRILDEWDGIDMILLHVAYDVVGGYTKANTQVVKRMVNAAKSNKKPTAMLLHHTTMPDSYAAFVRDQRSCWEAGFPALTSMRHAALALSRFAGYHEKAVHDA